MPINISGKKLLLTLIIFGIIALSSFFLYKHRQSFDQTKQETQKEVQNLMPEEKQEEQQIATSSNNLKIYRNEEWGFEFQYPKEFLIKENAFVSYYSKFNLRILHQIEEAVERAAVVNIVLPEFAERSFSGLDKKTKEIVIDGIPGVEYEYEFNERREKVAIFPFGDFRLILGIHYEEYEDLYRQILSTFKFLK